MTAWALSPETSPIRCPATSWSFDIIQCLQQPLDSAVCLIWRTRHLEQDRVTVGSVLDARSPTRHLQPQYITLHQQSVACSLLHRCTFLWHAGSLLQEAAGSMLCKWWSWMYFIVFCMLMLTFSGVTHKPSDRVQSREELSFDRSGLVLTVQKAAGYY